MDNSLRSVTPLMALDTEHINASKNDACNNSKGYKRPEISQVIGFMSDTAYSIYLKNGNPNITIKSR